VSRDYLPLPLRSRSNRSAVRFFAAARDAVRARMAPRHFAFAAAFFFLAAHAFFMVSDIFLRKATSFADDVLCFAAAGAFAGTTLGVAAGAAAAAFAALTAAQRFFVAAIIALLPAALSFRFAGAIGPTVSGSGETCSTDGSAAFRPEPGVFSGGVVVP
jgi:hypothetical protein